MRRINSIVGTGFVLTRIPVGDYCVSIMQEPIDRVQYDCTTIKIFSGSNDRTMQLTGEEHLPGNAEGLRRALGVVSTLDSGFHRPVESPINQSEVEL